MGARKLRLQMTPEDICRDHKQSKDPYVQIAILAQLNGVRDKDIRDILIDFGELEGTVSQDYSRGIVYVDGFKRYPDEEVPEPVEVEPTSLPKKSPTVRLTSELKDLIRNDILQGMDLGLIADHRRTSKANVYRIRKELETESGALINTKSIRQSLVENAATAQRQNEARLEGFCPKKEKEHMEQLEEEWQADCTDCLEMIQLFLQQLLTKRPSYETKESLKRSAEFMIGDLFDRVPDHLLHRKELL